RPTSARRAGTRAGTASSRRSLLATGVSTGHFRRTHEESSRVLRSASQATASQGRDDFALGRDGGPPGGRVEPVRRRGPELDVEAVERAQDPGNVASIGEPVVAAREVRLRLERALEIRELRVQDLARLPAAHGVVRTPQPVLEPLEPEPPKSALRRIVGPERGVRGALLQVLHDHARLRQYEPLILLVDRHTAERVLLVEPGGAVVEVDLDRVVAEALLGEDDPDAGRVRAALGRVEREHGGNLASPRALKPH